jgi:hypothetical protein
VPSQVRGLAKRQVLVRAAQEPARIPVLAHGLEPAQVRGQELVQELELVPL